MITTTPDPELLRDEIRAAWPHAQAHWSRFLMLREPIAVPDGLARIHLGTREIALNTRAIADHNLAPCLEALLAHEIGHHVRYPGTLTNHARLRLLERTLLPIENFSVLNLFTDLLINAHLGSRSPALADAFCTLYAAFHDTLSWKRDPSFLFYLAVYEELWQRQPGSVMGPAEPDFRKHCPDYRADAQLLAQNLPRLGPNLFTQYIYFVSVLSRYLKPFVGDNPESQDPCGCDLGEPSPEDWADALTPSRRELDAIEHARREGWLTQKSRDTLVDSLGRLDQRILGLPGVGTANAERVPEVMAAYYRKEAERLLIRPPGQRTLGEALVPTTLEHWEVGDDVRRIDWLATFGRQGAALGTAQPLLREAVAEDEGFEVPLWQPRVEIYLDVSGSMPDPRFSFNAMTLAAQILTAGTIRAGGWVRALLYASAPVTYWNWCRSEREISGFLMHYIGSGTTFPFGILRDSVRECGDRQPIRVIISDHDFLSNHDEDPAHAPLFADAATRSPNLITMLHLPPDVPVAHLRAAGASVVRITDMDAFPEMAKSLTRALFDT